MKTSFLAMTLSLVGWLTTANAIDEKKLVDMTYTFASDTLHWPTAKPFQLDKVAEGRTAQGYWYSSYNYGGSEHVALTSMLPSILLKADGRRSRSLSKKRLDRRSRSR